MRLPKYSRSICAIALAAMVSAPLAYGANNSAHQHGSQNNGNGQQQGNKSGSNQASESTSAATSDTKAQKTQLAYQAAGVLYGLKQQADKKRIPKTLVDHARCIAVFPAVFKEGLIASGSNGNGIVSCRGKNGSWKHSAPVFYDISGGSIGFQAGAKISRVVILFLNSKAAHQLGTNHFKAGANAGVSGGDVGRHANAHNPPAATLAYRINASGGFAGAEIKGSTITADKKVNRRIYGKNKSLKQLLFHKNNNVPQRLSVFQQALEDFAPGSDYNSSKLQIQKNNNNKGNNGSNNNGHNGSGNGNNNGGKNGGSNNSNNGGNNSSG
jgi:lipid-binding SYLF domain-containing protein